MQDNEKAVGKFRKTMPDFVKIHEPKDNREYDDDTQPRVQFS